jgi:hypothetical protein
LFILRQPVAIIFLTSTALLALSVCATAAPTEEDLKADIVYFCYNQMGEFGAAGVDICVKAEQSALRDLSLYSQQHREIVQRCTERVEGAGWQLVKACVDKDIAATQEKP